MEQMYMRDTPTEIVRPLPGVSFCAESPEAEGLIPDACPLVTRELLIAAAGAENTPKHAVDMGGVEGLYDFLYGDLLPCTEANTFLLRETFGDSETEAVHPIGRYAAVLAEAAALAVMTETAEDTTPAQVARRLEEELDYRLGTLCGRLAADGTAEGTAEQYAVRMAACRLSDAGEGFYAVDLFAAGDYRLYLLDADGLHELWEGDDSLFTPGEGCVLTPHAVNFLHPDPFALLLLSAGASSPDENTPRGREPSGRVWRHRMRLEEAVLHLLTACLREEEFGDRAEQYFAGHIHRGCSASGALLVCGGEDGGEQLIDACRIRLHHMEELVPLLPEGYHPTTASAVPDRYETECEFLAFLLAHEHTLSDRAADAVYLTVLERLRTRNERPTPPPQVEAGSSLKDRLFNDGSHVTDLMPLSDSLLDSVFAAHNAVNAEDRCALAENHRVLEEALAEHWVTWRPLFESLAKSPSTGQEIAPLLGTGRTATDGRAAHRAARDRDFAALLVLNTRLSERLTERRRVLDDIDELLTSATRRLHGEGNDWLSGLGGDDNAMAWAAAIARLMPLRLSRFDAHFRADTDRYRSLLVAYRTERERLFRQDALHPDGFFAAQWQAIRTGTLSAADWDALRCAVEARELGADYAARLEAMRRISGGCGVLLGRMERRGAERLTARELARRIDLKVTALRASIYCDPTWVTGELLTQEQVQELIVRLRRRNEAERLATRRKEAFEAYQRMYRQI